MLSKDPGLWNSGVLGSSTSTAGGSNPNSRTAAGLGTPSATVTSASNASYAFLASATSSVLLQGTTNGISNNPTAALMPATVSHDRSQELCKYFLNGGCLRGAQCQYLHELPDERHLDVNGYGYILNPNVHNAQKTLPLAVNNNATGAVQVNGGAPTSSPLMLGLNAGSGRQSHSAKSKTQTSLLVGVPAHLPFQLSNSNVKVRPPKYRPPEPFLEYNLPPTLALPFNTPSKDVALQLTRTMLQD
ncbi:Torus domain [Trypanosoma melophagium]|uniref:Torus domain n=1 Tax=Trypanosoma melophagium TaxID=715481 RepID=UPI003519FB77|nr:Torus domain [Trypanosoma melophagium]